MRMSLVHLQVSVDVTDELERGNERDSPQHKKEHIAA